MLPARSASGPLSRLTRGGQPVSWNRRTVKGVDYVVFDGDGGRLQRDLRQRHDVARRCPASPRRPTRRATRRSAGNRRAVDLAGRVRPHHRPRDETSESAEVTKHEVELNGLAPNTTYRFRVTLGRQRRQLGHLTGRRCVSRELQDAAGSLVDSRTAEFAAGTHATRGPGRPSTGSTARYSCIPPSPTTSTARSRARGPAAVEPGRQGLAGGRLGSRRRRRAL